MADHVAEQIIAVALGTHGTHPQAPALEVLDLAMQGREGAALCFKTGPGHAFDDWLEPPSPFAELLRQAFAPSITREQLALWCSPNEFVAGGFREQWNVDVRQRFAERYRLGNKG